MARTQITLDPELQRRASGKAASLGVSFAEYMRRVVISDLGVPKVSASVSELFALGETHQSNVAEEQDRYLAQAVEARHPPRL